MEMMTFSAKTVEDAVTISWNMRWWKRGARASLELVQSQL